jgi:BirA family biotin operon repressor/biotin-[acetyl-CoA-carboxylase] ligase
MLQEGLQTKLFGKEILFSREVGSTSDWAKELALLDAKEGTVAVAETQKAGHGRLGRKWVSPKGGLWFSLILKPSLKPAEAVKLVFVAGLAVAEALRELYCLHVETKWPNDVLVNGKKICGVIAEMNTTGEKVNFVVIGVGINANFDVNRALPEELLESTTSLENALGRSVQLNALFKAVLEKLEYLDELFVKQGFNPVLTMWKKYAGFLGHEVEVSNGSEKWVGLALDVDDSGRLNVKLDNGTVKRVLVGEVTLTQG